MQDFCDNLRLLCSYDKSIAAVCRALGLNRQQFNKYLSGVVFPSRSNLRRICDYFGVTESEILLAHPSFADIIAIKPKLKAPTADQSAEAAHIHRFQSNSRSIPDRYLGLYYRYIFSFAFPGFITKSLFCLFRLHGNVYSKDVVVSTRYDLKRPTHSVYKSVGMVSLIADRICIIEESLLLKDCVTQVILYPSYSTRVGRLIGIQTGISDPNQRIPAASRVLFEYLAPKVDLRKALRVCGQLAADGPEIDPDIRKMLSAGIQGGNVMTAFSSTN